MMARLGIPQLLIVSLIITPLMSTVTSPKMKKGRTMKSSPQKSRVEPTPVQARLLQSIYYNAKSPAGFSSAQKLVARSGLPPRIVMSWLRHQPTYTLHHPRQVRPRAHYPYRVYSPRLQFQADLVDYSKYAPWNEGYKFMLVVIDIFSKKAWAVPLKTKGGKEVAQALDKILDPPPERLQVDQGSEFYNQHVTRVLKAKNVERFSIFSQYKCAVVERLNRTIKDRLERIFTATNSKTWIHVLNDVMEAYNNSHHRTIGMAPNQVTDENVEEVVTAILKSQRKPHKAIPTLPINTRVRISRDKGTFGRGYEANWSTEEFFVEAVRETPGGPPMYTLRDAQGEIIKGSFYPQEVQRVDRKEEIYQIDEVLDRRRRRGRDEVLVHWQGYPPTMNTWIPASSLQSLPAFRKH